MSRRDKNQLIGKVRVEVGAHVDAKWVDPDGAVFFWPAQIEEIEEEEGAESRRVKVRYSTGEHEWVRETDLRPHGSGQSQLALEPKSQDRISHPPPRFTATSDHSTRKRVRRVTDAENVSGGSANTVDPTSSDHRASHATDNEPLVLRIVRHEDRTDGQRWYLALCAGDTLRWYPRSQLVWDNGDAVAALLYYENEPLRFQQRRGDDVLVEFQGLHSDRWVYMNARALESAAPDLFARLERETAAHLARLTDDERTYTVEVLYRAVQCAIKSDSHEHRVENFPVKFSHALIAGHATEVPGSERAAGQPYYRIDRDYLDTLFSPIDRHWDIVLSRRYTNKGTLRLDPPGDGSENWGVHVRYFMREWQHQNYSVDKSADGKPLLKPRLYIHFLDVKVFTKLNSPELDREIIALLRG